MKYLFILNDPPYGTERSYNALRLARELRRDTRRPDRRMCKLHGCARPGGRGAFRGLQAREHGRASCVDGMGREGHRVL